MRRNSLYSSIRNAVSWPVPELTRTVLVVHLRPANTMEFEPLNQYGRFLLCRKVDHVNLQFIIRTFVDKVEIVILCFAIAYSFAWKARCRLHAILDFTHVSKKVERQLSRTLELLAKKADDQRQRCAGRKRRLLNGSWAFLSRMYDSRGKGIIFQTPNYHQLFLPIFQNHCNITVLLKRLLEIMKNT